MNLMTVFIQLASGALGGNIAGALLGRFSLGVLGNSVIGIVGGGLAGQILWYLGAWGRNASAGLDLSAIFWSIAGGVLGGGILILIIGGIRMMVGRATPA
ncbi:MAG TPA: hypothetical protein VFD06_14945 [Candidatus Polarisedimenticolia bacterium]|nr:hypothetical protein [Candidatus Polarisedimenticolia bacterium]